MLKRYLYGGLHLRETEIVVRTEDKRIAGVIGQTPSLDHQAEGKMIVKREGMGWFLN